MHLVLILALLSSILAPWPTTLSLSSAEVQRGQTLTAVASAPAGAAVALQLPAGVSADLLDRQGETVRWRLTVASTAPLSRTPRQVVLLVGGQAVASAPLRIWTEDMRSFKIALPIVLQKRE